MAIKNIKRKALAVLFTSLAAAGVYGGYTCKDAILDAVTPDTPQSIILEQQNYYIPPQQPVVSLTADEFWAPLRY